jgi:hypothetical protein
LHTSVGVSRCVLDLHRRGRDDVGVGVEVVDDQLGQRLQPVQSAVDGLGSNGDHRDAHIISGSSRGNVERVGLVGGELGIRLGVVLNLYFHSEDSAGAGWGLVDSVIEDELVVPLVRGGQRLHITVNADVLERLNSRLLVAGQEGFRLYV